MNSLNYAVIDRYYADNTVEMTDSATYTIGAAGAMKSFSIAPTDQSFDLAWTRTAYEALMPAMGPNLADDYNGLFITAQPGGLGHGVLYSNADLLIFQPNPDGTDIDAGTVQWGNPFPSSWGAGAELEYDFYNDYNDGTNDYYPVASVLENVDASTLASMSPFVPVLGPVQNILVDGNDAMTAQNVGATPTISWQAPAIGTATNYEVTVFELDAANQPYPTPVVNIITKHTAAMLQPGVLTTGKLYYVRVTAENRGSVDVDVTPYAHGVPEYLTDALSNVLTASF
jgi:hypothetical protein